MAQVNHVKVIADQLLIELSDEDVAELIRLLTTAFTIANKIRQALSEDEHEQFLADQVALKAMVTPKKANGPKRTATKRKARMDTAHLPPKDTAHLPPRSSDDAM